MAQAEPRINGVMWLFERIRRLLGQTGEGAGLMGRAAWRGVVEVAYGSDDLTHAAAIAYYALLSFLPFMLLSMSVLGSFAAGQIARGQVLEFVLRYFPAQPDFIANNLDTFSQTRIRLGLGGAIGLLWASQGVFGAISTAVNHAWSVERPRTFWGHRWFTLLMMSAAALLLFAALLILSTASIRGTTWSAMLFAQYPGLHMLTGWASRLLAFMLFVLVVGMIFFFVPNTRVLWRDVWPGAVITALAWRVAFEGFSWYVRHWARASVHGSIATVVWFLVWIYISAVILLYGVEFTAAFARLRRERHGPHPPVNAS
ncbi:MAG: YihY/virulence factor BrkB family protein [Acidobacteria bacterium]|nr:YihY/virulence factor BrkB family protein [Acidobacteriota bacterium]